jgi:hypothetical protein
MRLAPLSLLLLLLACSSNDQPPAGPGRPDAGGAEDSGTGGPDAGTDDAGTDAGADGGVQNDAGTDGGLPDGGSTDGGATDGGGGCEAAAPVTGTVLASGLNTPRRLAVDATHLYISESHSLNPNQQTGAGRLLRRARSGGPVTAVATGFRAPDAIAVDDDSIYVLDLDGLWRVDKATGMKDARQLDTTVNTTTIGGTEVRRATLDNRDVLVIATAHRRLVRVDTDGANRQELFAGTGTDQVRGARVVGTDVYFLVTGPSRGLYRVPLDGSRAAELYDANVVAGTALEVTPTHFLITEGGGGTGQVLRLPRSGGAAEVLATGLQGPLFPVEANGTVYFKETAPGGTAFLRRVRACAPGTSDPVGPTGTGPGGLLVDVDGNTLFYTSQESGTGGAVGSVP